MKIFQFITFHTKLQPVQNHCVLGSIKTLLGFVRVRGGEFRFLVLFYFGLFSKIFDKIC